MKKILVLFSLCLVVGLSAMENKFDWIEEETTEDIFGPRYDLFSDEELSDSESSPRGIKRPRDEFEESIKKIKLSEDQEYQLQKDLQPLLRAAAASGDLEQVKKLLKEGAGLDDQHDVGGDGLPPLYFAVINNQEEMVKFLLDSGADPDLIGPDMVSADFGVSAPLFVIAADKGYSSIADMLFIGSDWNDTDTQGVGSSRYAVVLSIEEGTPQSTEYLMKKGWRVNDFLNLSNQSALMHVLNYPIKANPVEVSYILIKWGADIDWTLRSWYTSKGQQPPSYHSTRELDDSPYRIAEEHKNRDKNSAEIFALFEIFKKKMNEFLENPGAFKSEVIQIGDNSFEFTEDFLAHHIYYGLPWSKNKQMFTKLGKTYIKEGKKELFTDLFKDFYLADKRQDRRKAYEDLQSELLHFKITQGKQTTLFGKFKVPDMSYKFK